MDGGAKTQLTIEAFANKRTKEDLDDAVATFFSSAIAFNASCNRQALKLDTWIDPRQIFMGKPPRTIK